MSASKKKKNGKKRKPTTNDSKLLATLKALGIPENKVIRTSNHKYKVSALLGDFAIDFLQSSLDDTDYLHRVNLAALAWNLSLFVEEEREQSIQNLVEGYNDKKLAEKTLRALIKRKIKNYDEYKYLIIDTEVTFKGNDKVDITVDSLLMQY